MTFPGTLIAFVMAVIYCNLLRRKRHGTKENSMIFKAIAQLADNTHQAASESLQFWQNFDPKLDCRFGKIMHWKRFRPSNHRIDQWTLWCFHLPIDREDISWYPANWWYLRRNQRFDLFFENLVVSRCPETKTAQMIATAAKGVHTAAEELPKFKVSKQWNPWSTKSIASTEADRLYSKLKKRLLVKKPIFDDYQVERNLWQVWRNNASEDAVDIIDGMIIKILNKKRWRLRQRFLPHLETICCKGMSRILLWFHE